jgi:hypothetical protein
MKQAINASVKLLWFSVQVKGAIYNFHLTRQGTVNRAAVRNFDQALDLFLRQIVAFEG